MFSFAEFLDLPLIWYGLIMTAMFLYVILDGFDLGVGILFPFAGICRPDAGTLHPGNSHAAGAGFSGRSL